MDGNDAGPEREHLDMRHKCILHLSLLSDT